MRTSNCDNRNQQSNNSLPTMSDEQLLLAYRRDRDQAHFTELVTRYRDPLLNFLKQYVTNSAMAEDVLQATFLQLHLKGDQFEEGRKLRPWLYRIAVNQAIDAGRRHRRHEASSLNQPQGSRACSAFAWINTLDANAPQPHDQLQQQERGERVRAAVAQLPVSLRAIVSLVFFQGLKYREAAEALSMPVSTLKSRMHTALVQLRTEWPDALLPEAA